MGLLDNKTAIVTGSSRGIGADVAKILAGQGAAVVVNYRQKAPRANKVVQGIEADGGRAVAVGADLTTQEGVQALASAAMENFGSLDILVLNASGGMETGMGEDYALKLNRDAQVNMLNAAVPLMKEGSRVVFVTSHQAHFFPHKAVPKGYSAIAASKRAGETALYSMRSDFDRAGVRLTVVSGDMVDGSVTVAAKIVNAATTPNPSGIVYVGGADYLMTA